MPFGILSARLDRERTWQDGMHILAVAADRSDQREAECAQETFEVAECDYRPRVVEKALIEFRSFHHGCFLDCAAVYESQNARFVARKIL
jgi:hypothetical protein